MAKFSPPSMHDDITRSSIRVPKAMLERIETAMENTTYNRKQRSKWIEEITAKFLLRSDAANLIAEEFIVPGSTSAIPVTISTHVDNLINIMIEKVFQEEGIRKDRSSVIRTAITQNLMASAGMQLSSSDTHLAKLTALGGFDEPNT